MKNNLHNAILSRLQVERQVERQVVTLYTTNGFRMKGRITGFDALIVVVEIRNEQQIVYRQAISTIASTQPINLKDLRGEEQECRS